MTSRDKVKIDLNSVDAATLSKITGISVASAKKIVKFCAEKGPVKSESELSLIPGLSKTMINKISPYLDFSSEQKPPVFEKFMRSSPGRIKMKIPKAEFPGEQATVSFDKTTLLDKNQKPLSSLNLNLKVSRHENSFVNFKIPLSRHNPPGSHKIEMIVNNARQEIVVDIAERTDVRMLPDKFYLENKPGEVIEKVIFIANMGNVPLNLKDPTPVMLESEFLECRMIRDVVHQMKSQKLSVDEFLSAFANKLENLYQEAGTMKIRFSESLILAPGEKAGLTLKIQLPKSLKRTQKYTGTLRIFNAAVLFKIQ